MLNGMNINRIEFVVTYRCNSHCKHCQVVEAKRHQRPQAIRPDLAGNIVRRIAQTHQPSSVMTFGGEPLLYLEAVCAIHQAAKECGIPARQVITNAGMPRSPYPADTVAQKLAASGVNDICISVDTFHQEYVPVGMVERNVRAYLAAGIDNLQLNPCWVVSPEGDNPYDQHTRAILQELSHLPVRTGDGNRLQPAGNAQTWLSAYLPPRQTLPAGSCENVPYAGRLDEIDGISIEPDGGVNICQDWIIGNAAKTDILEILDGFDPHAIPEAATILRGGMAGLVDHARSKGVEPDPQGYFSICEVCVDLRQKIRAQSER